MREMTARAWLIAIALAILACGGAKKTKTGKPTGIQTGQATWYGGKHHHNGPTASGERFNENAMTAAHLRLPFGTRVRVTNLRNNRSVILRINDRGPYGNKRRIIDVSKEAARRLDMIDAGVVPVRVEVIK
jgi:rare lipoprotein A